MHANRHNSDQAQWSIMHRRQALNNRHEINQLPCYLSRSTFQNCFSFTVVYNIRVSFVPERTGPLSGNSLDVSFDLAHGEAVTCSLATLCLGCVY